MRSIGPRFVGMFVADLLVLAGLGALVLGLVLTAAAIPVAWLAGSGAALALVALAVRYLLAQTLRATLDRMSNAATMTIYMPLLNEGTGVWRPVEAMKIGHLGYMVTQNAPPDEEWAFQPGHILRCEERQLDDGKHLVAVGKAI